MCNIFEMYVLLIAWTTLVPLVGDFQMMAVPFNITQQIFVENPRNCTEISTKRQKLAGFTLQKQVTNKTKQRGKH